MQKKLLKIDSSIYPPDMIRQCISLFDGYDIVYSEKNHSLSIDDIDELVLEFFNTALSLTIENSYNA